MNKDRRIQIAAISDELMELNERLEKIRDDEQQYFDNIPENLQGTCRYQESDDAINDLDMIIDEINESVDGLNAIATRVI